MTLDDHALPRDYAVFQQFHRQEDSAALAETLRGLRVAARTGSEPPPDAWQQLYVGSDLRPRFWVEIPSRDFERARFLLREKAEEEITETDLEAHPFADYTTDELKEVLRDERGWDVYATVIARKILLKREKNVDLAALRAEERRRITRRFEPKSGKRVVQLLVIAAGIFCGLKLQLLGWALAAGVLVHFGWSKHRKPSGERVFEYAPRTRTLCRAGVLGLVLTLVYALYREIIVHEGSIELMEWLWVWR